MCVCVCVVEDIKNNILHQVMFDLTVLIIPGKATCKNGKLLSPDDRENVNLTVTVNVYKFYHIYMCVCVRARVCVCEREREREGGRVIDNC